MARLAVTDEWFDVDPDDSLPDAADSYDDRISGSQGLAVVFPRTIMFLRRLEESMDGVELSPGSRSDVEDAFNQAHNVFLEELGELPEGFLGNARGQIATLLERHAGRAGHPVWKAIRRMQSVIKGELADFPAVDSMPHYRLTQKALVTFLSAVGLEELQGVAGVWDDPSHEMERLYVPPDTSHVWLRNEVKDLMQKGVPEQRIRAAFELLELKFAPLDGGGVESPSFDN